MGDDLIKKIPDVEPPADVSEIPEGDYGAALEELKFRTKVNAVEKLEHDLEAERLMLNHRKNFSFLIFGMAVAWLGFIGVFLWNFSRKTTWLGLPSKPVSDSVLIALITTTTANVLGLFFIVAHWLFPNPSPAKSKRQKAS